LDNGRKSDPAILSTKKKAKPGCKLFDIMRIMMLIMEKFWPMTVPAAAVIQ